MKFQGWALLRLSLNLLVSWINPVYSKQKLDLQYVRSEGLTSEVSFPASIIARWTALLCNVGNLDTRIIYHSGLPICWQDILGPNPLPIVPGCHHHPELQRPYRNSTCVPNCPIIPAHIIPICWTNLISNTSLATCQQFPFVLYFFLSFSFFWKKKNRIRSAPELRQRPQFLFGHLGTGILLPSMMASDSFLQRVQLNSDFCIHMVPCSSSSIV